MIKRPVKPTKKSQLNISAASIAKIITFIDFF